jgi:hypothetical protein
VWSTGLASESSSEIADHRIWGARQCTHRRLDNLCLDGAASTPISAIASTGQWRKVRPRFAATSSVKPISMTTVRSFPFATQTK